MNLKLASPFQAIPSPTLLVWRRGTLCVLQASHRRSSAGTDRTHGAFARRQASLFAIGGYGALSTTRHCIGRTSADPLRIADSSIGMPVGVGMAVGHGVTNPASICLRSAC